MRADRRSLSHDVSLPFFLMMTADSSRSLRLLLLLTVQLLPDFKFCQKGPASHGPGVSLSRSFRRHHGHLTHRPRPRPPPVMVVQASLIMPPRPGSVRDGPTVECGRPPMGGPVCSDSGKNRCGTGGVQIEVGLGAWPWQSELQVSPKC
jgi:hypothetical protein